MGEHRNHHLVDNLNLRLVEGSNLDENVLSVQGDLRMVAVDDGRQGANCPLRIVDDGVDRGVANNVKVSTQVLVFLFTDVSIYPNLPHMQLPYLVEGHQLLSVHFLGLVQRNKFDVFRRQGLVGERSLYRIQVVSTDRNERSLPCKVLVKFVLQGDEGFIASLIELDVPQDSTRDQGSDFRSLCHISSAWVRHVGNF